MQIGDLYDAVVLVNWWITFKIHVRYAGRYYSIDMRISMQRLVFEKWKFEKKRGERKTVTARMVEGAYQILYINFFASTSFWLDQCNDNQAFTHLRARQNFSNISKWKSVIISIHNLCTSRTVDQSQPPTPPPPLYLNRMVSVAED